MSNSALISGSYTNHNKRNSPRNNKILKITPHHAAGNLTFEGMKNIINSSREMSCNYIIQSDGKIFLFVNESDRSWCSSSPSNDHQAITIEVANDGGAPDWHVSDAALASLLNLCTDICQRNGIAKLNFTGNANGNLTQHNYFANTACPGPYLKSKFPYIAEQVNARLASGGGTDVPPVVSTLYRVQVGAFGNEANANSYQRQAIAAGFTDAFIKREDNLYKVQIGAYTVIANAQATQAKAKAAGFKDAFISVTGSSTSSQPVVVSPEIVAGSNVRVNSGAKFTNGVQPIPEVYTTTYTVMEPPSGNRIVIGIPGVGITGAFARADLTAV